MSPLFSTGKRSSSSTPTSSFLSRLPSYNSSSSTVSHSTRAPVPRTHLSTDYSLNSNPPPYDGSSTNSPVPTPSTSWTSEMSALADRIKDHHASIDGCPVNSLDRKSIAQGMKLFAVAADEFENGSPSIALDIYLSGIDKVLMALPYKTDPMTKQALRDKLTRSSEGVDKFKRLMQVIINTTVTFAILIKQSPLPDIVCFMFTCVVQFFVWIDGQYHIVNKVQDLGIECVKLMLKMDEQYHLHELASEAIYVFVAAGIKAAVAYKEAPAFRDGLGRVFSDPIKFYREDHREECQTKSSSRWTW
ncbi:hypothetical protein BX666DRAFT_1879026 [Dichotomocladium elegans]|nr:hypothetical protein BX666DRAFT_1879026 [Dichotomocladium elegans]